MGNCVNWDLALGFGWILSLEFALEGGSYMLVIILTIKWEREEVEN